MQCLLSKAGRRDGSTLSRHGWREEAAFFRFEAEIPVDRVQKEPFVGKIEGKRSERGWISVSSGALFRFQLAAEPWRKV
ncbi:hypothetical protein EHZ47_05415 [Aeromonas jandaei]|nr:hypothetical protein EHZ47_05415 [Aeromonas jandaei]